MTTIPQAEPEALPISSGASTVQRLAAVPVQPRPRAAPPLSLPLPEPASGPHPREHLVAAAEQRIQVKVRHNSQVLAVVSALVSVLSVRLYLLLSVLGAFVLGLIALEKNNWIALSILAAYCCLTVIPLCVLDVKTRQAPSAG